MAVACLFVSGQSCAALGSMMQSAGLQPPEVEFQEAVLVQAPSRKLLAAYACPNALATQTGLPLQAAALSCRGLFGAPPTAQQTQVAFDLRFKVKNPNRVPLPLAALSTAVSVFPESQSQRLGDVCVAICSPQDVTCNREGQKLCQSQPTSVQDAALNFLVSQGLRLATGQRLESGLPPLSAEQSVDVVARFAFAPEGLLPAFVSLAKQSVAELKQAQAPSFRIPYNLEGQVHADGGALGPLSANFGNIKGEWQMPTQALVPGM